VADFFRPYGADHDASDLNGSLIIAMNQISTRQHEQDLNDAEMPVFGSLL
jgi:hypothetical protein